MEEIFFNESFESLSDREFLRISKNQKSNVEKVKVKCLGWCNEEFMSESKFLRFCEKCKAKKNKISEDNYISEHGSCGIQFSDE